MRKAAETYEVHHRKSLDLTTGICPLEKLADGMLWTEGPVWFGEHDFLVWSDIPNNRLLRWVPGLGSTTFRLFSNYANGNTRDREGRLVSCEQGLRRGARTQCDGAPRRLAARYEGAKVHPPNDLVVGSDGAAPVSQP